MSNREGLPAPPPARFGPFHRLASPTQTADVARLQVENGEIWGRIPRRGASPRVEAYAGPLPPDRNGIEFWTDAALDRHSRPMLPTWGALTRHDVRVHGEFAKITCVITCVRYESHLK